MARKEPKVLTPAAERSALAALQQELDDERVAHAKSRAHLQQAMPVLHARIAELEAELAQTAARVRELEERLQARGR
jgi:chromosome segregation ATPase